MNLCCTRRVPASPEQPENHAGAEDGRTSSHRALTTSGSSTCFTGVRTPPLVAPRAAEKWEPRDVLLFGEVRADRIEDCIPASFDDCMFAPILEIPGRIVWQGEEVPDQAPGIQGNGYTKRKCASGRLPVLPPFADVVFLRVSEYMAGDGE